jgi:N-acetylglutamate synthase-like GNAT family acetyltransferase
MNPSPIQILIHGTTSDQDLSQPLDMQQLLALFQVAAFWARDRRLEDLERAIAHSNPVVSAWQDQQLVGFARAISDGVYRATIWDVVVHPDHQSKGIGRNLVETVLSHPHVNRVERVYLMTTFQEKFYERVGFRRNSSTTMVLHQEPLDPLRQAADGIQADGISGAELAELGVAISLGNQS